MEIMYEEFEMIGKINPNIFGGLTKGTLETCSNCGKLMEWNNSQWECFCKGVVKGNEKSKME